MTKNDLKIVFMGTPDFAVESLRALVEGGYRVVGVVTAPDKPVGRHGRMLQPSAVKKYALALQLPILQPEKLKDDLFIHELRSLQADLQLVVAFRMLPEMVWNMPRLGTINLHASLLPQYRGAAPIHWAIINGETETGVTTFFLTHEIDTGRIILQRKWPIAETDDAGIVHDALMQIGAQLVLETVDRIIQQEGKIETIPQEVLYTHVGELRLAKKIVNETCRIDWSQTEEQVYNFIRGLSPYPTAWTELINSSGDSLTMKIFASKKEFKFFQLPPGAIHTDRKRFFDVAVADGFIRILSLQLAGKKRMPVQEFLRGTKIDNQWRMSLPL